MEGFEKIYIKQECSGCKVFSRRLVVLIWQELEKRKKRGVALGGGEKGLDSGCILKEEPLTFADLSFSADHSQGGKVVKHSLFGWLSRDRETFSLEFGAAGRS